MEGMPPPHKFVELDYSVRFTAWKELPYKGFLLHYVHPPPFRFLDFAEI